LNSFANLSLWSKRVLVAVIAVIALGAGSVSAAAAPPAADPGSPGCIGRNTGNFAQDWKTFTGESKGVAGLVRYFGGTNPTEWLLDERLTDCTAP
jgi:hypothetical protein